MSDLATILDMCQLQLRETPIVSTDDIIRWLETGVRRFCLRARWLDGLVIIPAKANCAIYLLPGNHIATTSVYYNETKLQRCNNVDAQLVSPTGPVYYYEDDWQDEASQAAPAEFAIQISLEPLWALQQMHAQNTLGRRTVTFVAAPTVDGNVSGCGSPTIGMLEGQVTSVDLLYWPDGDGIVYALDTTEYNFLVFYKAIDVLPYSATDTINWSDGFDMVYSAAALNLALGTEDDEYDRYRAWIYGNISDSVAAMLNSMSINRKLS